MPSQQVSVATQEETDHCVALIVLAFSTDPAARWLYSESSLFLAYFPRFVRAFAGKAFEQGTAHVIDRSAAALWLAPGTEPEETLVELIKESAPESNQDAVLAVLEEMGRYRPQEPHWYLPLIGTDPMHQGRGYGSALLRYALALCDEEQVSLFGGDERPKRASISAVRV